jgi:multiple sugar transport system ATP-binding protein
MRDGLMQQTDTPMNLYNQPINRFVAEFIGSPQMNLGKSRLHRSGQDVFIQLWGTELKVDPERAAKIREEAFEKEVYAGIRPEHMHIEKSAESFELIDCIVDVSEQTGPDLFVIVQPKGADQSINARVTSANTPGFGDSLDLWVDTSKLYLFDMETDEALIKY